MRRLVLVALVALLGLLPLLVGSRAVLAQEGEEGVETGEFLVNWNDYSPSEGVGGRRSST